jgi:hypothetical protein
MPVFLSPICALSPRMKRKGGQESAPRYWQYLDFCLFKSPTARFELALATQPDTQTWQGTALLTATFPFDFYASFFNWSLPSCCIWTVNVRCILGCRTAKFSQLHPGLALPLTILWWSRNIPRCKLLRPTDGSISSQVVLLQV